MTKPSKAISMIGKDLKTGLVYAVLATVAGNSIMLFINKERLGNIWTAIAELEVAVWICLSMVLSLAFYCGMLFGETRRLKEQAANVPEKPGRYRRKVGDTGDEIPNNLNIHAKNIDKEIQHRPNRGSPSEVKDQTFEYLNVEWGVNSRGIVSKRPRCKKCKKDMLFDLQGTGTYVCPDGHGKMSPHNHSYGAQPSAQDEYNARKRRGEME